MPIGFGGLGPTFPTCNIQISFTAPYATPSWVDITDYVRAAHVVGPGRQHEMQRAVPTTVDLTLINDDGRFNPWNTAGPYAAIGAGLVPEMPCRMVATWQSTTYPVWYCYIDSWTPAYRHALGGDITIRLSDMRALLAVNDITSTRYSAQVLADGPAAYYRMDDLAGPSCADITGHGNTGTYAGIPTYNTASALLGDPDPSVDLAGVSHVNLPLTLAPTGNNPFTWECWFNLDGPIPAAGQPIIAANVVGNPQQMALTITGARTIQMYAVDGSGTTWMNTNNWTVTVDTKWHHLVVTYDGATTVVYLDGQIPGGWTATAHAPMAAPTQFQVGAFPGSVLPAFNAKVDEVAVYTAALTSTQVVNHYQLGGFAYTVQGSGDRFMSVAEAAGVPPGMLNAPSSGVSQMQAATSSLVGTKTDDYLQQLADTESGFYVQATNGVLSFFDRHYVLTTPTSSTSQATFEDAATSAYWYLLDGWTPGVDNLDLWNEVVASAQAGPTTTGAPQVYRNGTVTPPTGSIGQYGKRTYTGATTGLLFTKDGEARDLAYWIGSHYNQPLTRIRSIRLDAATNAGGNLVQMLGRQVLDRVTVKYNGHTGGTALTQQSIIEGVEHDIRGDPGTWVTTWHLSPAETKTFLILNDAVLGKLDSGNALAF